MRKTALFVNKDAQTDYFIPSYEIHSGQRVEVIGPYDDSKCPLMWRIRAADGWQGLAQANELLEGALEHD